MTSHSRPCNSRARGLDPSGAAHGIAGSGGFTLIELVVVTAVVGIVAAIATSVLLGAKISANEVSAVAAVRTVISAQSSYSSSAAQGAYAPSLAALATACPGESTAFISPDLAADPSQKSGYTIALGPGLSGAAGLDCHGDQAYTGFYVTATPVVFRRTGLRAFASTNRGVIYYDPGGVAPTEADMAPGGGGTVIQ